MGAPKGAALPLARVADEPAAGEAGFPAAPIDVELQLEVARPPFPVAVIAQGGPPVAQRRLENPLNARHQAIEALAGDPPGRLQRIQARAKKRLVGVDVPDAGDNTAVHEEGLDRHPAAAGGVEEIGACQSVFQGFRPEARHKRVLQGVAGRPQHPAETPRVMETQAPRSGKEDFQVVVFFGRRRPLAKPQVAGHPEVNEEAADIETQDQDLAPALHLFHAPSHDERAQAFRHRPAQAGGAGDHPFHPPADKPWCQAAANRFHFGQFRHNERLSWQGIPGAEGNFGYPFPP